MLNISCLLSPPNSLWANVGCWAVVGRGVKGWHASSGEAPISGSQLQRVWGSAADSYRSTWLHTLMLTDNVPGLGPPCVDMWVCAWMCVCLSAKAEVKATDMHTLYSHWILLVATTSSYSLWPDSSELLWCGSGPAYGVATWVEEVMRCLWETEKERDRTFCFAFHSWDEVFTFWVTTCQEKHHVSALNVS